MNMMGLKSSMKSMLISKIWIASFCLFVAISCKRQHSYKLLIGHWKIVKTKDSIYNNMPPPPFDDGERRGYYEFINDSLVDNKRPYFQTTESANSIRQHKFLGTITRYEIEEDSLKIFSPRDSTWENIGFLKSLTDHKMILVNKRGKESVFLRHSYENDSPEIDAIALSSSGCFGTCPITNIIIESDGNVTFYGERYINQIGFFEGQISEERFEQIRDEFNKAGIKNLVQNFSVRHSDDETISTTFSFKNKFINSIKDYGKAGPDELVWGYNSLRYLFQGLELRQLDSTIVPFYLDLHYFRFEKGKEICDLTQSESFLLWNYLRKGTLKGGGAPAKYSVQFFRNYTWFPGYDEMNDPYREKMEEKVNKITTNGQLYTFDITGQRPVTIDIGFNFFEVNQKFLSFRSRGEYD
jgi:hypothetical protein